MAAINTNIFYSLSVVLPFRFTLLHMDMLFDDALRGGRGCLLFSLGNHTDEQLQITIPNYNKILIQAIFLIKTWLLG